MAGAVRLIQVCTIYWISALTKTDASWRIEGTSLSDALRIQVLTTPLAEWLLQFPTLLKYGSFLVLLIEELGPLVAIITPFSSKFRVIGPLIMISLHLGIAVSFSFGLFPWIAAAAWLLFLPPQFWDWLARLFVGVRENKIERDDCNLIRLNVSRFRSEHLQELFVAALFGLVMWWNLTTLQFSAVSFSMPQCLRRTVFAYHLNQNWKFFAPKVNTREGWFEIEATLKSGRTLNLDLDGDEAVMENHRLNLSHFYPNKRYRQYFLYLFHSRKVYLIEQYAFWLRSEWSNKSEDPVAKLKIDFLLIDSRFPEDGVMRVQVHPVNAVDEHGKAFFDGDERRNIRLKIREANRSF